METNWLNIKMTAKNEAVINIKGHIGIPEYWQNDETMAAEIVSTKEKMASELSRIANLKADKVIVNIDSFGGDVNHGLSIYNALASLDAEVIVNYVAWSASVATIIGAAGNIVNAPNNFLGLIHEARSWVQGTEKQMVEMSKTLTKINLLASDIYALKSGKTSEEMLDLMALNGGEGEWKTADELKKIGLIDNVTEPLKAAASFEGFQMEAKKYNLNTNINFEKMGIFKKETNKLNTVMLGDINAAYEGELKAGVKLIGLGVDVVDGTFELEGGTLVVENYIVKSYDTKKTEVFTMEAVEAKINEVAEPLKLEIQNLAGQVATLEAEKADIEEKYNNLASLSSTHKPNVKAGVNNEAPVSVDLFAEIKKKTKETIKANKQTSK